MGSVRQTSEAPSLSDWEAILRDRGMSAGTANSGLALDRDCKADSQILRRLLETCKARAPLVNRFMDALDPLYRAANAGRMSLDCASDVGDHSVLAALQAVGNHNIDQVQFFTHESYHTFPCWLNEDYRRESVRQTIDSGIWINDSVQSKPWARAIVEVYVRKSLVKGLSSAIYYTCSEKQTGWRDLHLRMAPSSAHGNYYDRLIVNAALAVLAGEPRKLAQHIPLISLLSRAMPLGCERKGQDSCTVFVYSSRLR